MMWWLLVALLIEAILIEYCHFGLPVEEPRDNTFTPYINLLDIEGEIYDLDIPNNKFILVANVYGELLDIVVHSKNRKTYNIGDIVKIVEQSDGLYFIE